MPDRRGKRPGLEGLLKLPAFQFYVGDWRKDPGVQSLSFHDRGVWFEILCLMHESESRGKLMLNGAAMPEEALARLLGLDKQILTTTLTTLLTYGVASSCDETGAIMSRRMVRDEYIRKVRAKSGKLGGNPNLLNQNPKQKPTTKVNQIPTPSSSTSTSTSSSEEIPPNPQGGTAEKLAESIWSICPKFGKERSSKSKLLAQLKKLPATTVNEGGVILESLNAWIISDSWTREDGQFVPGIDRWIKDGKWQFHPEPASPKGGKHAGIQEQIDF